MQTEPQHQQQQNSSSSSGTYGIAAGSNLTYKTKLLREQDAYCTRNTALKPGSNRDTASMMCRIEHLIPDTGHRSAMQNNRNVHVLLLADDMGSMLSVNLRILTGEKRRRAEL